MVVLNPVTGEIRKVPDSPFALDPLERFITYGFGYDSVSDDYKIVTISYNYDVYKYDDGRAETFVDVYSLKTDTWKKAGSCPYNHAACVHFIPGVFVDGCIHWLACRNTDDKFTIVAFDLAQEKFREVPPPSPIGNLKLQLPVLGFSCLLVLCGRLCAFTPDDADVWVMEKYGVQESWTKLTVYPKIFRPLCMLGQKEIVLKGSWSLVVYNLEERTVMDIDVRGIRPDALDAANFVESLVSPHATNQRGRD